MKGTWKSPAVISVMCFLGSSAAGQTTVDFDDLPVGAIGDGALSDGVRFFRGDGAEGMSSGDPAETDPSAEVLNAPAFALSSPNIMVPASGSNNDIFVHFYRPGTQFRVLATSGGICNDREDCSSQSGCPPVMITAFRLPIPSWEKMARFWPACVEASMLQESGTLASAAVPGSVGLLGVDDFSFQLDLSSAARGIPTLSVSGIVILSLLLAGLGVLALRFGLF